MSDDISDPRKAYWPNASGTIETKAHRIERLRAELEVLNSRAGQNMPPDWHAVRRARIVEIEAELKAPGETP